MRDQDDLQAIGELVSAVLLRAAGDESLRPGVAALGRMVARALEDTAPLTQLTPAVECPAGDAEQSAVIADALLDPDGLPSGAETIPDDTGMDDPVAPDGQMSAGVPALASEPARVREASVPVSPTVFKAWIEDALRNIASDRPAATAPAAYDTDAEADDVLVGDDTVRDAQLGELVRRMRLRAALARAVAEERRGGAPVEPELLHGIRSALGSTWIRDLPEPDLDALDTFATCLEATADAGDLWVQLGRHGIRDLGRRAFALRGLAAVQSALRVAGWALRAQDDDDQVAVFRWLKDTTWAYQIYVDRHMRADDPLDPALVGEVVGQIQGELKELRARTERQVTFKKKLSSLRYHAGRIDQGKGDHHDEDKVVESTIALVEAGMPPSSLELRAVLLPVLDLLPAAEGQDPRYGRVLAELNAHVERMEVDVPADQAVPEDAAQASIGCPTDAIALARLGLPGVVIPETALQTIGEIDGAEEARAWGRSTYRALRALDAYSQDGARYGNFWDWCATSGHHFAWPATTKKLALHESETVMNGFRESRVFAVDIAVDPSGEILMEAHCKIAEGGGRLSPRLYFHDDTKGATGKVHIGFAGPHRYVPNASTN